MTRACRFRQMCKMRSPPRSPGHTSLAPHTSALGVHRTLAHKLAWLAFGARQQTNRARTKRAWVPSLTMRRPVDMTPSSSSRERSRRVVCAAGRRQTHQQPHACARHAGRQQAGVGRGAPARRGSRESRGRPLRACSSRPTRAAAAARPASALPLHSLLPPDTLRHKQWQAALAVLRRKPCAQHERDARRRRRRRRQTCMRKTREGVMTSKQHVFSE